MISLRSHHNPDLLLAEHLDQMRTVARAIWTRHSPILREQCDDAWEWISDSITFHDAGKGSEQFQVFIKDPDRYRGRAEDKYHTPLSLLCVLAHGCEHKWAWPKMLAMAAIAAGHHSELKTEEDLCGVCASYAVSRVLERQLGKLDWEALDYALGVRLTRVPTIEGDDIALQVDDQLEALFELLRAAPNRLSYRLRCQLAFSVLLEADKAFLAIEPVDVERYLNRKPIDLAPSLVDQFLTIKPATAVNPLRELARTALLSGLAANSDARIFTMTLPTGMGKTLLGATWALDYRQRLSRDDSPAPKVIIVLPFLSIIDQTVKEYSELLASRVSPGDLISFHSLSQRTFDPELNSKSQDFFLDTWQSDFVITTFDQLLLALFSPRAKHQLRFHNLADALIVLDEIQSIPCILWEPLRKALSGLTELGSTRVLAMSATQPGFLPDAAELIREPGPTQFFGNMNRYRLVLGHTNKKPLSEFIAECRTRLREWKGKRVLLTFNTRRSAREVFEALAPRDKKPKLPVFFITGDKTPRDRLTAIGEIKTGEPCLVVSTQCVEAGVDIDMEFVIRDFGPLDSLIQIAGRCNRNANRPRGIVEVVSLLDDITHREFAGMVYSDKLLLQATSEVLRGLETIDEEHVYPLTVRYFDVLRREKNLGTEVVESWINWKEIESVRDLFRGKQSPQVTFVVVDQAPDLVQRLEAAKTITDHWEQKRELRELAPEIARVAVTVFDTPRLDPSDFAEPFPSESTRDDAWFWLVRPGIYDPKRGLDLKLGSAEEPSWGMII